MSYFFKEKVVKNRKLWVCALGAAILAVSTLPASAHMTIDRFSPSIAACPVNPGDLFRRPVLLGACPGPGPLVNVPDVNYGLNAVDDTDALAVNEPSAPNSDYGFIFSGDPTSQGALPSNYRIEFVNNQAAGDLWRSQAIPTNDPWTVMSAGCGAPATLPTPPWPTLFRNQDFWNLIPFAGPGVALPPGAIDDIDGFDFQLLDNTGDAVADLPFYFSIDPASAFAAAPADVIFKPVGAAPFVWANDWRLGLGPLDDVDGLVVWDRNVIGMPNPGVDLVLFSLGRGSFALRGPDGVVGTADDFSPADVFVSDLTGAFCLYMRHSQLGLLFNDNLDALEVKVWPF
jgi:hypothetical protein